jgi:P4 family phage/plasmid primase-like protien
MTPAQRTISTEVALYFQGLKVNNTLTNTYIKDVIPPNFSKINPFLKTLHQWGFWKKTEDKTDGSGRYGKRPVNAKGITTNLLAEENWQTFDAVTAQYNPEKYSGVALVLGGKPVTYDKTGVPLYLIGGDIDNCIQRNVDGSETLTQEAESIIQELGLPYYEKSPSGTGLRWFCLHPQPVQGFNRDGVEVYSKGRWLTITGVGTGEIKRIDQPLTKLCERYGKSKLPSASSGLGNALATTLIRNSDPETPARINNVKQQLSFIDCESRDNWLHVGMALRSTGWQSAYETWCDWSKQSAKYDEVDQLHTWVGLNEFGAITLGTINYLAEQGGWQKTPKSSDHFYEQLESHVMGDILAGRIFAQSASGKLLYVSQAGKWLKWNNTKWDWCSCDEEIAHAKQVADQMLDHATGLDRDDYEKFKKHYTAAVRYQNVNRLEAMVQLAKSEQGMCIGHMTELDSDHFLLGVRNGVLNLRDGGVLTPDPLMRITRQVAAEYHNDATCPKWFEFLSQVFNGDQETIDYIQRALGYSLTGSTTEEVLFICHGYGANGKSVFGNVVSTIMADYARTAPPSLLTARRPDDTGARSDLAMLCGARLTSINETQNGDRLDEQVVKQLAGREQISARFMYKDYFEYWPTAKGWLRTNHKPIITGEDDGIWRRLHLIPFRVKFAEEQRDPYLESKLLDERDGILAWMVQGCLAWQRVGLKPSPVVRCESATYRKESDLFGEFIDEKTVADHTAQIGQAELFTAWCVWNNLNGTRHGSKKSFTRKLTERGFEVGRSNGGRYYVGLRVI